MAAHGICLEGIELDAFGLGLIMGILGTLATLSMLFNMFLRNLRTDDNGSGMWSSGGLQMPSFFFRGAADIFNNVQEDTAEVTRRFKETGRFDEIYKGIQRSQEDALLRSIEALRQFFPRSATRNLVFGAIRSAALSSRRVAASLYDFAVRLQPTAAAALAAADASAAAAAGAPGLIANVGGSTVLYELWALDENRCSVSGRRRGEGRQPWVNEDADILVDFQAPALRRTVADMAKRPIFAHVAPGILAKPTYLALVQLFGVFNPSERGCAVEVWESTSYSDEEEAAINEFLDRVMRTAVMRRALVHVTESMAVGLRRSWKEELRRIWFRRLGGPSVFEHVFLGNLAEDDAGQLVAGGLHCWLKFYLEEVRGTANFLGYIYNRPEEGLSNSRFVAGKFVWDCTGCSLVKEQGGFFVGVSPEWQIAVGTVAYFETRAPDVAESFGWYPWPGARGKGYTKDVVHDGFKYRHVVCRSGDDGGHMTSTAEVDEAEAEKGDDDDGGTRLCTTYAIFLGVAQPGAGDTAYMDQVCESQELAARLPARLVEEGIALRKDSEFSEECARFCVTRGCSTLREALRELREVFTFALEDALAAAAQPRAEPPLQALVEDAAEVATLLLEAADGPGPLSSALPGLLARLKKLGRRGPKIHRPLRLLLTGRADGARVADIVRLLELAETAGADEAGARLQDRVSLVRETFGAGGGGAAAAPASASAVAAAAKMKVAS